MSEEEKKIRSNYRKVRKRLINLQLVILILVLLVTVFSTTLAIVLNKKYYVNYSEKSSVDYGVSLKENNFYEDSYLGKDYEYIASLIDRVQATFKYELQIESQEFVNFEYNYRVDAVVQIKHKISSKVLYSPVYNEVKEKSYTVSATNVSINQTLDVDYSKYNNIADAFINTYDLNNIANANLILQMHVNVLGTSDEFQNDTNENSYIASISIPLTTQTVDVKITSVVPPEEQKILSCTTENIALFFRLVAIISASIAVLLAIILWLYAFLSRNIDITYDIKVAKLWRNYKSFIQKMRNAFNVEGYQLIVIDTFNEMLEIRDTIQSPILMNENEDRTCTKFFIPTDTKLLYLFEIKVDDYDDIYNSTSVTEPLEKADYTEEPVNEQIEESVKDYTENAVKNRTQKEPAENFNEETAEAFAPIETEVIPSEKTGSVVYRLSVDRNHTVNNTFKENAKKTFYDKMAEPSIFVNDVTPKKKTIKVRVKFTSDKEE